MRSKQTDVRRAAVTLLTRRDHSQKELIQKLSASGFPIDEIHTTVNALVEKNLLNESRFTENFIHWRRNRGYGPHRIAMELQSRGLPAEMIAEHLDMNDNVWFINVRNIWQKHFKGKQPKDLKERAKQIRFLQYRGFSQKHIESIWNQNNDN